MARPRSEDKRAAIMAAAVRVIVSHGLSAPTAMIAREAGVASGSLFTYFPTKAELFNRLYFELKSEVASAALDGLPTRAGIREQLSHLWSNWTRWAVSHREKRRVLAHHDVSDEVTPATRAAAHEVMAHVGRVLERSRASGPLRDAPMRYVVAVMTALAEATVDYMAKEPADADRHCKTGFDALWRVIG